MFFSCSEWDAARKNKRLNKFAEENQDLILPTRHRNKNKRGREADQEQAQLPPVSANNRPRNQARHEENKEKEEEQPVFEARIVLAPPSPPAASPLAFAATVAAPHQHGAAAVPAAAVHKHPTPLNLLTLGDACLRTIKNRKKAWKRLDKQGKIPSFLKQWMQYCKSLTAYECPDYDKLRALLQTAPEVAHIAQALHGIKHNEAKQQPVQMAMEHEE